MDVLCIHDRGETKRVLKLPGCGNEETLMEVKRQEESTWGSKAKKRGNK
jgi:hypothetical protein